MATFRLYIVGKTPGFLLRVVVAVAEATKPLANLVSNMFPGRRGSGTAEGAASTRTQLVRFCVC